MVCLGAKPPAAIAGVHSRLSLAQRHVLVLLVGFCPSE